MEMEEELQEEEEIEEEEEGECNLNYNEIALSNDTLTMKELTELTTYYAKNYGKSESYITKLENEYFKIYIYNNILCLQETSQEAKWVDFGESYSNFLSNKDLSKTIISIITNKTSNFSSYAFAHPKTGELLDFGRNLEGEDQYFEVKEDIYTALSYLDSKQREYLIFMLEKGINIFDGSHEFYFDLCYHYDSPNNKDIAMRDRATYFFANIVKCESNCIYKGIDYELLKFNCQCPLNSFVNPNDGKNVYNEKSNTKIPKLIESLNIEVFKCIKDLFNGEYFKTCTGGYIMLIFSIIQILCMLFYLIRGILKIKRHAYSLFESFKKYSGKKTSSPPKKGIENNKSENIKNQNQNQKDIILLNSINKKDNSMKKLNTNENKKLIVDVKEANESEVKMPKTLEKFDESNEGKIDNEEFYMKIVKQFAKPKFDENDFDDVMTKDKRTFIQFFEEKLFNNQIFIKTFYITHIFKPITLKIMSLVLMIELYFVISALFYTETYLSERFHSDEKENFLTFIPNRINAIIYTCIISGIIGYFISYIFDNDDYIRRVFSKKLKVKLDTALIDYINNLKRKFIILIVISMVITIFAFFYIACFNIVYPYIKSEWLKTSIFVFIIMQIVNLLSTLLGVCCRYLAIKLNNVKLFRLSLNLD